MGLGGSGIHKAVKWTGRQVGGALEFASELPNEVIEVAENFSSQYRNLAETGSERAGRIAGNIGRTEAGAIGRRLGQNIYGLPVFIWIAAAVVVYLVWKK